MTWPVVQMVNGEELCKGNSVGEDEKWPKIYLAEFTDRLGVWVRKT